MNQINSIKIGKFIAQLRQERNLTQKEFADMLYVSDKTISKWERGAGMPNVTLLLPIANSLGISVTELLVGEKIKEEENFSKDEVERIVTQSFVWMAIHAENKQKKSYRMNLGMMLFAAGFIVASFFVFKAFVSPWQGENGVLNALMSNNGHILVIGSSLVMIIGLMICIKEAYNQ